MSTKVNGKWVRFRCAGYLRGRGLTFGADDVFNPSATDTGKYSINVDLMKTPVVDAMGQDLGVFADGSLDHVFVGRRLEAVEDLPGFLRTLCRKLKLGGHLMFHLPIMAAGEYEHHQFVAADMPGLIESCGRWQTKDSYERDGYFLQIYKRVEGRRGVLPPKPRSGKPRACICRYGALGDMVILTPLIRQLATDGYEVTLNITPYAAEVVKHNPYVTNVVLQERDIIPNPDLGEYWREWQGDYERYINLSESLEGELLKVEGRRDYYTPQTWRRANGEHNYYDHTMAKGGYPEITGVRGEVFFTDAEEREARKFFEPLRDRFVILWAMNGSAHHKVYPMFEPVAREWLDSHPDSTIITVGDYAAKLMEFEHPQVINRCGEWSVRESMIAAKYASLVVGPETFLLNVAGCFETPKLCFLSHSTHEALTRYWSNDYSLAPDTAVAPCHPCYQLHYSRQSCPFGQMIEESTGEVLAEGPLCCMNAIPATKVLSTLQDIYETHHLH